MWPRRPPFVCTPAPQPVCENLGAESQVFERYARSQHSLTGYNERLSRINLYAPAHNKPFPFKSSQKANLSW